MVELPDFSKMGDEDFVKALSLVMDSAIGSSYYRVFGQSMLPIPIKHVERYVRLSAEGKTGFNGRIVEIKPLKIRPEKAVRAFIWKDCDVSKGFGLTFDLYVWGLTRERKPGTYQNTVFTRRYWWKGYFIRSLVEDSLRMVPGTLRLRDIIVASSPRLRVR